MSTRAAFGLSAAISFGVSVLFGAPLAVAAMYGLIAGVIGAALYNAPPVRHGIGIIRAHPVGRFGGGWFGPRATVVPHLRPAARVVHGSGPVNTAHVAPESRGWIRGFTNYGRSGLGTGVSRTTAAPLGGTRTSFIPSGLGASTHGGISRGPVFHTRTMLLR